MKVKYLYGSFKQARVKKLTNEYLFYLQLQSIGFNQNEIYKGSLIKEVQKHFDYSPASISHQVKRLLKCGFLELYKHDSGKEWKYIIKSYRSVWNKLGFRFKEYIERFKFDFINITVKSELKALIFTVELQRNKVHQDYVIQDKLNKKIKYHQDTITKTKSKKIKEKKEKALLHLLSIKTNLEDNLKLQSGKTERSMVNRISCKRASVLLGFNSIKTVSNLHKKAESMNFLSVKKEITLITENISKIEFSMNPEYNKCYWMFGKVYRNECNVYNFNVINTVSSQNKSLKTL